MKKHLTLIDLKSKQTATVLEINGGQELDQRLHDMGIRPGIKLTVIGKHYMRGPVTVKIGNSQIALGHKMSGKITVEPVE